jgi:hypothetical protein
MIEPDNTSKAVYCLEKNTTYPSIRSVVNKLGIRYLGLRNVLSGSARTIKGMHFEWYDPAKHPKPTA